MEILIQREKLRTVLPRWEQQYPHGREEITAKLRALDWNTVTAAEVDAIIGNSSWTHEMCRECGEYAMPVVRLGKYTDDYYCYCATCIGKAAVLADAFSHLK